MTYQITTYRKLLIFMYIAAIFNLIVGFLSGPNYFLIVMAGSIFFSSTSISAYIIKKSTEIKEFNHTEDI